MDTGAVSPATATRAFATGAVAAFTMAIGVIAVGAFAIGRLSVRQARFGTLEIDRLIVHDVVLPSRHTRQARRGLRDLKLRHSLLRS